MENDLGGGWIYVMMTSSDYGRFKVGRTIHNPLDRAKALRTGDPGVALEAAYFIPSCKLKLSTVEAALHSQIEDRLNFHDQTPSEWFKGTARWACEYIEMLLEEMVEEPVCGPHMLDQGRICKLYDADLEFFYGIVPPDPWLTDLTSPPDQ